LSIAWGVVSFFAGRGLWNGQQWGRILAITSSVLYIIFGVITMFTLGNFNYFSLVINLVIILYLLLSKDVRTAFASAKPIGTTIILAALAIIIFAFMEYPNLTPKETKMEKALRQMHEASKLLKKYQK
jgi:cytochrome bd-type quinol oxidase subunit 2